MKTFNVYFEQINRDCITIKVTDDADDDAIRYAANTAWRRRNGGAPQITSIEPVMVGRIHRLAREEGGLPI